MRTEQEAFWSGSFGDEYTDRNRGQSLVAANTALFARMFGCRRPPASVIELGANIGNNLAALRSIFPQQDQYAVEINPVACEQLAALIGEDHVTNASILDWNPARRWDLVLLKGVLIHIHPDRLGDVYSRIAAAADGYVALVEYYNPEPVTIPYRGHADRLFKRDFCRDFLSHADGFELVDYGFVYRGDPAFPQDDLTWFLLRRTPAAR